MQTKKQYEDELSLLKIEANEMKSYLAKTRKEIEKAQDEKKELWDNIIKDKQVYGKQAQTMLMSQSDQYSEFIKELAKREKSVREREQNYSIRDADVQERTKLIEEKEKKVYNMNNKAEERLNKIELRDEKVKKTQQELDDIIKYTNSEKRIVEIERKQIEDILRDSQKEKKQIEEDRSRFNKTKLENTVYWKQKEAELKAREESLAALATDVSMREERVRSDMRALVSAKSHIQGMLNK